MTSTEWWELGLSKQEEHLAQLSKLAQKAFPHSPDPDVQFNVELTYGWWRFIVCDRDGRTLLMITHRDALEVGEETLRLLAGVGLYWRTEI